MAMEVDGYEGGSDDPWQFVGAPVQTPRKFPWTSLERSLEDRELPTFFGSAKCNALSVAVEETVLVRSDVDKPHIGRIKSLFCPGDTDTKYCTLQWYIRPEELRPSRRTFHKPWQYEVLHTNFNRRFSTHTLDCIIGKCTVFNFLGYCRFMADKKRKASCMENEQAEEPIDTAVFFVQDKGGIQGYSSKRAKRVLTSESSPEPQRASSPGSGSGGKHSAGSSAQPRSNRQTLRGPTQPSSKDRSPDFQRRNKKGETPLHLACMKGNVSGVKDLIRQGALVDVQDNAGWTPLHEAALRDHGAIVQLLLRNGANPNLLGPDEVTALHEAAEQGYDGLCGLLLKHGADINVQNSGGQRPIDLAPDDKTKEVLEQAEAQQRKAYTQSEHSSHSENDDILML